MTRILVIFQAVVKDESLRSVIQCQSNKNSTIICKTCTIRLNSISYTQLACRFKYPAAKVNCFDRDLENLSIENETVSKRNPVGRVSRRKSTELPLILPVLLASDLSVPWEQPGYSWHVVGTRIRTGEPRCHFAHGCLRETVVLLGSSIYPRSHDFPDCVLLSIIEPMDELVKV